MICSITPHRQGEYHSDLTPLHPGGESLEANALTPRDLFDPTVCYEVPPFQRPYVWTEEDQWQPLWDDLARVVEAVIEAGDEPTEISHFLGAVVLKFVSTPAGAPSKHWVIDGQQRLTTLQLLLDAAQLILTQHGENEDAESMQELVLNRANRFRNTPNRFKLWPSRVDQRAFEQVMDDALETSDDTVNSRICQAHTFFLSSIHEWADVTGDPAKTKTKLSALAQVLQQRLQVVAINLAIHDDDQLIFETLNDRGTPLLQADLIKNFVFQQCLEIGADVDAWNDKYWQDFDDDWWRDQVAQGRLYRSRIDLFLQYWLTMRLRDEIPTDAVFSRFRTFSHEHLQSVPDAEGFLRSLRKDADSYRELVTQDLQSAAAKFYGRVVESLELGAFIPLLLWLISDNHDVPEVQVATGLGAVESWAVRRTLLRMTMKDVNKTVVSALQDLDGKPIDQIGPAVVAFLSQQTADARSWPTDEGLRQQLHLVRVYGNIKQPRIREVLSAIEMLRRNERHESISLPDRLEIEHVMPRGWRTYWGSDIQGDLELAAARDVLVDTLGNLTLVTKKLNGSLSNRPWRDNEAAVVASSGQEPGVGKRSLLNRYSLLVLNKEIVQAHPHAWTEDDIRDRARDITEAVIKIWPRPA